MYSFYLLKEFEAKYMVKEDDLTLGGGHTMQYTDYLSQKCRLETYMTLLTNASQIYLIKEKRKKLL